MSSSSPTAGEATPLFLSLLSKSLSITKLTSLILKPVFTLKLLKTPTVKSNTNKRFSNLNTAPTSTLSFSTTTEVDEHMRETSNSHADVGDVRLNHVGDSVDWLENG